MSLAQKYEKFLDSKDLHAEKKYTLDQLPKRMESELILIDLVSLKNIDLLESVAFKNEAHIIFISPRKYDFSVHINRTSQPTLHYITKPINIKMLETVLHESIAQIKKDHFLKSKEDILARCIDHSPIHMAVYEKSSSLLYANTPYLVANDFLNRQNIHFSDIKSCAVNFQTVLLNLQSSTLYKTEKNQGDQWYKSLFYMTNDSQYIVHFCFENTKEKHYEEYLYKSSQFFDKSNEGAYITDEDGVILAVNEAFCKITGYTKDEAVGSAINILSSGLQDEFFYERMWASLKFDGRWQGEIWNKRRNGEIYPQWLSISKLVDEETSEENYLSIFSDITSLKESTKKLDFYANHDYLTGLLNKVQFSNMLEETINSSVRNRQQFALFFLDLDYFKDVNDTAGHHVGDSVLQEVSARLKKTLRKEDILARIGGDEFNIIVKNFKQESDVLLLAEKLNESIRRPFVVDNKVYHLSLSIGIALFPSHGLNKEELSKNADSAMYEVKKAGRDGALLYNKAFSKELMKKVQIHHDLKEAIKQNQLEVYYQPFVDILTKKIIGAEALLRWEHPENGFIPPDDFIPVAEHHGFIIEIGSYVLRSACEALPFLLNKFGNDFLLAINVSSKEFYNDDFIPKLITTIDEFNLSYHNFELEITETHIMENQTGAIEKMKILKAKGFSISLDDFGTGYSSLSYLKKFPIDKLKIDQSFVLDILNHDEDDRDLVEAIVHIAKIFHLAVQAEGVETEEHFEILKELRADIAQGFYFGKAIPLKTFLLHDWELESDA
jgi:diguanylate cyclase (GGDEF)-like protein/PAS domain S-box-containing protein